VFPVWTIIGALIIWYLLREDPHTWRAAA
jgi:hypothetical protein